MEVEASSEGGRSAELALAEADKAILSAKSGEITVVEMLDRLVKGYMFLPLAEPIADMSMAGTTWKPAIVTKRDDGTSLLIAFTDSRLASHFAQRNPNFAYGLCTSTEWVLQAVPPAHGLLVNVDSEKMFEWESGGLERYKRDVIAARAP